MSEQREDKRSEELEAETPESDRAEDDFEGHQLEVGRMEDAGPKEERGRSEDVGRQEDI